MTTKTVPFNGQTENKKVTLGNSQVEKIAVFLRVDIKTGEFIVDRRAGIGCYSRNGEGARCDVLLSERTN